MSTSTLDFLFETIDRFELHARVAVFAIDARSSRDSRLTRSPLTSSCDAPLTLDRAVLAHERGENRVDALLHFGVGQRAIGGLKRQPHRHADRAVRHAFALIAIEERDAGERRGVALASGRLNGATNDLRRQGVWRRRSTDRGRRTDAAAAAGSRRAAATRACRQRVEVRARRRYTRSWRGSPRASATAGASCPMSPTTASPAGPSRDDRRRSVPGPGTARWPARSRTGTPSAAHSSLDDALDVEEVDRPRAARPVHRRGRPVHAMRDAARFAARPRSASPISNSRDIVAVRGGDCARRRRRGPERATGAACRTSPRAGSRARRASAAGRRERLGRLRLDETERHRLRQTGRRQHAAHQLVARDARVGRRRRRGDDRERRRQLVEPVMAADLLDRDRLRAADRPGTSGATTSQPSAPA